MYIKNKKLIIAWLAVILWMLLIFMLSAQPTEQTNKLSIGVTERIMSTESAIEIDTTDTSNPIVQWNAVLRKIAHFSLFLVLGMLASYALRISGLKGYKVYLFAALFCSLYAASDELHQMFVPGRNATFIDVLIDAAGAFVGIGIVRALVWMKSRKQTGRLL